MLGSTPQVTQLLLHLHDGTRSVTNQLMPLVYDDFRALAARQLARERRDCTLQPTELVHEAYLRLTDQIQVRWKSRSHFLAVGSQFIRRILVDHARNRLRAKRGGGMARVDMDENLALAPQRDADFLALDEARQRLAALDPRLARIVELRFVSGMTVEEVARATGLSKRTIEGDWALARAWLRRELSKS